MKVIRIYNNVIPFKGFMAMLTLSILWIRNEYKDKVTDAVLNHESIHMYQQLELLILGVVVGILSCSFLPISWWWMIAFCLSPFLVYIICWIIEILLPPYDKAYKNICFESEAQYNEYNFNYLKKRVPFSWIKYISNKKYPYLTNLQRRDRWL